MRYIRILIVAFIVTLAAQATSPGKFDALFQDIPASIDTLKIAHPEILRIQPAAKHKIEWKKQQIIGVWMIAVCGGLSYYLHMEANEAYDAYLHSGSHNEMNRLYRKSQRLDRLNGLAYAGTEVGFLFTVFSFDKKTK